MGFRGVLNALTPPGRARPVWQERDHRCPTAGAVDGLVDPLNEVLVLGRAHPTCARPLTGERIGLTVEETGAHRVGRGAAYVQAEGKLLGEPGHQRPQI